MASLAVEMSVAFGDGRLGGIRSRVLCLSTIHMVSRFLQIWTDIHSTGSPGGRLLVLDEDSFKTVRLLCLLFCFLLLQLIGS